MSKTKRLLSMLLVVALVAGIAISGTLAYLTSTDSDVNVMTLGNVQIKQNEQERAGEGTLKDFTQGQLVYPAADVDGTKEAITVNGYDLKIRTGETYMDKIVSVTNNGKSDAYVRTIFALPEAGDFNADYNSAEQWFHWNGVSDTDTDPANGWMWGVKDEDGDYIEWPANTDNWNVVKDVEINGKKYDVYVATNKNILAPGASTSPSLMGFYLDARVDCDGTNYTFTDMNGKVWNLGDISNLDILVLSQAVQTAGFDDAWTALNTGFGEANAANVAEWFGGMNIPTVVSTAADLQNAMKTDGATIVLKDDIVVTADDTTGYGQHMFLANGKSVTIDLNGYDITIAEDASQVGSAFTVANGGKIILEGDGTVEIKNGKAFIGWTLNGSGSIEVRGGNYFGNGHEGNNALFYVQDNAGKIDVYGGKFTYPIANNDNWGFNAHNGIGDKVVIEIHEGTLLQHEQFQYGDNSRIQLAEGCSLEETVIDGETWYQVVK